MLQIANELAIVMRHIELKLNKEKKNAAGKLIWNLNYDYPTELKRDIIYYITGIL